MTQVFGEIIELSRVRFESPTGSALKTLYVSSSRVKLLALLSQIASKPQESGQK
jgi:hypothetical protein